MSLNPNAAGLAINWHMFGSNGQEKADYSRGVLERFTRRAPNNFRPNGHVKLISNPRLIMEPITSPHFFKYLNGFYSVQENSRFLNDWRNYPITIEKIVINHYHTKSREEYALKNPRGNVASVNTGKYSDEAFKSNDHNEEFDDGILAYRDARVEVYQPPKPRSAEDLIKALKKNLSTDSYAGKMETFLTCRAVSDYLKTKLKDDTQAKLFEEASLKAILKALENSPSVADKELFTRELPELLKLPYPVVEELRKV